MTKRRMTVLLSLLLLVSTLTACKSPVDTDLGPDYVIPDEFIAQHEEYTEPETTDDTETTTGFDLSRIPGYATEPVYVYNDNNPLFEDYELNPTSAYENYADLDDMGRIRTAIACLGPETLPTEERGEIGSVKPTGWHTVKYDVVDGNYLYNRCHLIAYELSAENANECNLATGTRYMNVEGMLPYENMTREYIDGTGNHVLYMVTPIFMKDELVCRGILMEAQSIEDNGDGLRFCVYCYNVQPGIEIDYATGNSWLDDDASASPATKTKDYILNTKSRTVHEESCPSVRGMSDSNKETYSGSLSDLLNEGYKACKNCNPNQQ